MAAIESAFETLASRCRSLRDRLRELRVTFLEDRPRGADLALFSQRAEALDDLAGGAVEAGNAAAQARRACDGGRIDDGERELGACHELLLSACARFEADLGGFERVAELMALARERGREWTAWSVAVRAALGECRRALDQAQRAALECWRDLVRRVVFSIGQTARLRGGLVAVAAAREQGDHDGSE